jgi:hypothetical protein
MLAVTLLWTEREIDTLDPGRPILVPAARTLDPLARFRPFSVA